VKVKAKCFKKSTKTPIKKATNHNFTIKNPKILTDATNRISETSSA
jgi:hypothetical protein